MDREVVRVNNGLDQYGVSIDSVGLMSSCFSGTTCVPIGGRVEAAVGGAQQLAALAPVPEERVRPRADARGVHAPQPSLHVHGSSRFACLVRELHKQLEPVGPLSLALVCSKTGPEWSGPVLVQSEMDCSVRRVRLILYCFGCFACCRGPCAEHRQVEGLCTVQTGRQTGQVTVTVTHNREEGRRDGWQREGEATGKSLREDGGTRGRGARREGGGRPAANGRGWRRWWTESP